MKKPRVLLADDHKILLEGLKSLLKPDFDIVGTVEDGRQVLDVANELEPDLVVIDISMPYLNGIQATRLLKDIVPKARIVILSMHADPAYAAEAFRAGAIGYVAKDSAATDLFQALRQALRGHRFVSPSVKASVPSWPELSPVVKSAVQSKITPRQQVVLQLLARGRSLKEISAQLGISEKTVEYHKYRMMQTLRIHSTAELIAFSIRQRLVEP